MEVVRVENRTPSTVCTKQNSWEKNADLERNENTAAVAFVPFNYSFLVSEVNFFCCKEGAV